MKTTAFLPSDRGSSFPSRIRFQKYSQDRGKTVYYAVIPGGFLFKIKKKNKTRTTEKYFFSPNMQTIKNIL